MTLPRCFVVSLPLLALLACAASTGYRVVKENATGGELALEGKREESRPQAEGYMRGRCGKRGYMVDREGANAGAGAFRGGEDSWRIAYTCRPEPRSSQNVEEEQDAGPSTKGNAVGHGGDAGRKN